MNRTIRYKEGVLEKDERIAVLGKGEWKEVGQLGLPEKYGKVLEIRSSDEEAIYLSDDPDTTLRNIAKVKREEPAQKEAIQENREGRYQK